MSYPPLDLIPRLSGFLDTHTPESVACVYLFGSIAEERAHRESDLDLGVLFRYEAAPQSRDRFELGLQLRALIAQITGPMPLDVVVLNDAPRALAARIVTTGQRLFCRDPESDHAFQRDVQLRAADLRPFLDRTRALKRQALAQ